jgi:hypothetical protein
MRREKAEYIQENYHSFHNLVTSHPESTDKITGLTLCFMCAKFGLSLSRKVEVESA